MVLSSLLGKALNFILPTPCQVCNRFQQDGPNQWFCQTCWNDIPWIKNPGCMFCGKPYLTESAFSYPCGKCQMSPPDFEGCISVGYYEGTFSKAIQLFKFHKKTRLAFPLAQLLVSSLKKLTEIDLLIPVPLHPFRLKEREFNQSFLLAYYLHRFLGLPFSTHHLERVKPTLPQVGLNATARTKNMREAFSLRRREELEGKKVLLVDDVLTTGSTVEACARLLKQKGKVRKVIVGTLARARPV